MDPSIAVVEAVAAEEGCEPTELPVPLYEYVDPEALDAFVASATGARVSFAYGKYEVAIDDRGVTVVAER